MFWQQRDGVLARPHHQDALRGAQGAHLRSIRSGLTVATVDLCWFLFTHAITQYSLLLLRCPDFPATFFYFSGTFMKALASSFRYKASTRVNAARWGEVG
jgi:hypothetical protein